jgi:hypothetical protein
MSAVATEPSGGATGVTAAEPGATAAEPGVADPLAEAFDGASPLHAISNNTVHSVVSLIGAYVTAKPARLAIGR